MSQPKVSVIIPVYNIERYLRRCLDSVIHQSLKDIEIICINDGSTDNSPAILKTYEKNDPRVRLLDKENAGQGVARNIGIGMAEGEYIGFVDGDDWIEPDMYERMYNAAKKNTSDLHLCCVRRLDTKGNDIGIQCNYERYIGRQFNDEAVVFNWHDIADVLFNLERFSVNKIYKSTFIKKKKIRFSPQRCYEDNIFHFRTFLEAGRISITREPLYNYMFNREDATSSKNRPVLALFAVNREIQKYMEDSALEKELVQRFENYKIRRYLSYCYIAAKADRKQYFNNMQAEFRALDIKNNPFVRGPEKIFYMMVRKLPYGVFKLTYMPGYACFYIYMKLWLRRLKPEAPGGGRSCRVNPLDVA